ncbi:MAG: Rv2231c family pyridoxal phosphate-dependent protein CobC [Sporichthyaceae bacterium]
MLRHHGDLDVAPGLVDLAVNVRAGMPPPWLARVLADSLTAIAAYPRPAPATAAVAERHGRLQSEVLLTSGAAEAFTLIARALQPRRAVVVHPQFTEPELALRIAGKAVHRLLLRGDCDFTFDPGDVPEDADLVMLGNPTNPTSRLHPAAAIEALVRPGRVVVVDEAFMDVVVGESESLARRRDLPGVLIVRSLTKTWGLAGLRVGYVLGAPELIDALGQVQPHWSVSTPALAAAVACSTPAAVRAAGGEALEIALERGHLVRGLSALPGVRVVADPAAPFVLAAVEYGDMVRAGLREHGFALRRGDTFPGLGPSWVRIAVRDVLTTDRLLAAWRTVLVDGGLPVVRRRL